MHATAISRLSGAVALGLPVTASLLYLMQALIATGRDPIFEVPTWVLPPLVPAIEPDPPKERRSLPDELPPPVTPPTVTFTDGLIDQPGVELGNAEPPRVDVGPVTRRPADSTGTAIPIVKVVAAYPPRAIASGLEGYVIVEYTVTRTGTVADVVVLASSHAIFESSAVTAAEKFRYRPRVVAGEPVATPGVLNKFSFELED